MEEKEKSVEEAQRLVQEMFSKNDFFTFNKDEIILKHERGDYPISIDKCDTAEKAIEWVLHLEEKTWMTKERVILFLQNYRRAAYAREPVDPDFLEYSKRSGSRHSDHKE